MAECLSVGVVVADHVCAPIDRLPAPGELVLTDELRLTIGGCAANAATDMARVGIDVAIIGCVGDDVFGRYVAEMLADRGVDVRLLRKLNDVGTSGTLIVNVRGQDRRFVHMVGANGRLRAADITWDEVRRAKILYVGGFLLLSALDGRELAEVFREARRAGVQTVLDVVVPGSADRGIDHWSRIEPVLRYTDVFLPNNDESEAITGLTDPRQQAQRFHEAGVDTVVITCGGAGTYLLNRDLKLRAAVYPMPLVGATGAGDAFCAGYVAGLLRGLEPRGCLAWGSALGASCVRSIGATESVFTRDEAEAFLAENPLKMSQW